MVHEAMLEKLRLSISDDATLSERQALLLTDLLTRHSIFVVQRPSTLSSHPSQLEDAPNSCLSLLLGVPKTVLPVCCLRATKHIVPATFGALWGSCVSVLTDSAYVWLCSFMELFCKSRPPQSLTRCQPSIAPIRRSKSVPHDTLHVRSFVRAISAKPAPC
jgi:hypothetical protein